MLQGHKLPSGMAQIATSSTKYGGAPRARIRRSVTTLAMIMPSMMHSA